MDEFCYKEREGHATYETKRRSHEDGPTRSTIGGRSERPKTSDLEIQNFAQEDAYSWSMTRAQR